MDGPQPHWPGAQQQAAAAGPSSQDEAALGSASQTMTRASSSARRRGGAGGIAQRSAAPPCHSSSRDDSRLRRADSADAPTLIFLSQLALGSVEPHLDLSTEEPAAGPLGGTERDGRGLRIGGVAVPVRAR